MTQMLLLMVGLFTAMTLAVTFYWNNKLTKFVTIALFVLLANAIYFSLDGVKGWPSEDTREVKGILASVVVVNPTDDSEGAIYISLFLSTPKKWYEYEYPRYAPKTFYIEYSNDRAAEFEKAKQAMEEGKEVRINGIPPKSNGTGSGEGIVEENLAEVITNIMGKILPQQGDTYKPKVPDVEIMEQKVPPEKGSQQ